MTNKLIELEENRVYVGKPLDIIGVLQDWVSAEYEMYYLNDVNDNSHLIFASNWSLKAAEVADWIEENGNDNYVKADIGWDYRTEIEITSFDNFLSDPEKMIDFRELSKEEFLESYSYLTEEEYDNTLMLETRTGYEILHA